MSDGDVNKGAKLFSKFCANCHDASAALGNVKQGPNLAGVVGRTAGTMAGFSYSSAMKKAGHEWNAETLDKYLTAPKKMVPGTKMVYAGMKKAADRKNLVAYLTSCE
jgi:cytochrome c